MDLDKWLGSEAQVKEMTFGYSKTTETLKLDGGKSRSNLGRPRKETPSSTFHCASLGAKRGMSYLQARAWNHRM